MKASWKDFVVWGISKVFKVCGEIADGSWFYLLKVHQKVWVPTGRGEEWLAVEPQEGMCQDCLLLSS